MDFQQEQDDSVEANADADVLLPLSSDDAKLLSDLLLSLTPQAWKDQSSFQASRVAVTPEWASNIRRSLDIKLEISEVNKAEEAAKAERRKRNFKTLSDADAALGHWLLRQDSIKGNIDLKISIQDLITNLLHLAQANGDDPNVLIAFARSTFQTERDGDDLTGFIPFQYDVWD